MVPSLLPGWRWLTLADGRTAVWSCWTGRHLVATAELAHRFVAGTDLPPVLQDRRHDLATADTDRSPRVVCRSAWALLLPERRQLWHARPDARTAGGTPWTATNLCETSLQVIALVDQRRSVGRIAEEVGISVGRVLQLLAPFLTPEQPAFQLRVRPPRPRDRSLHHLLQPQRPDGARRPDHYDAHGATTLGAWHEDGITQAEHHFDDVETTFAHAFARPHAALQGQTYGARLYHQLCARGMVPLQGGVLELGPGTGQLARDFIDADRVADHGPRIQRYQRVDRSPVLLAAQDARVPESEGLLGDATAPPVPPGSVDLVLSNEVLADLAAVPWRPDAEGPVGERMRRYGIPPLPGEGPYNLGAWLLVEAAAQALKPGGAMVLTEFGAVDEVPTETRHLNHPEVSIHFGHLAKVAAGCGLVAQLEPVHQLLDIDLHAGWLSRPSWEGVRALHRAEGATVEARAWTATTVPRPTQIIGLNDVPITEDGPAPVITRLWALVARRPQEPL